MFLSKKTKNQNQKTKQKQKNFLKKPKNQKTKPNQTNKTLYNKFRSTSSCFLSIFFCFFKYLESSLSLSLLDGFFLFLEVFLFLWARTYTMVHM